MLKYQNKQRVTSFIQRKKAANCHLSDFGRSMVLDRMKKLRSLFPVLGLVTAGCILFGMTSDAKAQETEKIEEGVYIGSIHVGGMTADEAADAIHSYVEGVDKTNFVLSAGDKSIEVKAAELGIGFSDMNVVAEAMDVCRSSSLIKRYKDKKDLENGNKVIPMVLGVDEAAVKSLLEEHAGELNHEAVDNGLIRENDEFKFIEGEQGIEINVEQSAAAIADYISGWDGSTGTIELVAQVAEPRGSKEELTEIKDMLGTYNTNYNSSTQNRCDNISMAAEMIDGTVLYPGEEFSVYEYIGPLDKSNGYKLAGAYENGQTVEAYGGGVCQVSTTLYNTVILAELEITQRSNHSMIVSYVKPSMDAAIAGDYKDLRFVNNKETPIYIEGYTSGKNVYFNIYGKETRPSNREISYVSEVISEQDPGTQFVATGDPAGYIGTTQSKHTGYVARLWKVVTIDGVEESREVYNKSTYRASPKIVHVGTASEDPNISAIIGAAIATGDEAAIYGTVAQYTVDASAVPAPEATPQPSPEEQAITGNVDESQITNNPDQGGGEGQ